MCAVSISVNYLFSHTFSAGFFCSVLFVFRVCTKFALESALVFYIIALPLLLLKHWPVLSVLKLLYFLS